PRAKNPSRLPVFVKPHFALKIPCFHLETRSIMAHNDHRPGEATGRKGMRIAIAGAGIGGLAAALALSRDGHDVRVYEAARELQPLGVGINLLPHAARILKSYGLVDSLLAVGIETRELVYHNRHGQKIWAEPRGRFAGFDAPQISLSRGALHLGL